MATVEIRAGVCGFVTVVKAKASDRRRVSVSINSGCANIMNMAGEINEVDAYAELSCKRGITSIISAGLKHCPHASCPVPAGVVKAVEVAAQLALPRDAVIHIVADDDVDCPS